MGVVLAVHPVPALTRCSRRLGRASSRGAGCAAACEMKRSADGDRSPREGDARVRSTAVRARGRRQGRAQRRRYGRAPLMLVAHRMSRSISATPTRGELPSILIGPCEFDPPAAAPRWPRRDRPAHCAGQHVVETVRPIIDCPWPRWRRSPTSRSHVVATYPDGVPGRRRRPGNATVAGVRAARAWSSIARSVPSRAWR